MNVRSVMCVRVDTNFGRELRNQRIQARINRFEWYLKHLIRSSVYMEFSQKNLFFKNICYIFLLFKIFHQVQVYASPLRFFVDNANSKCVTEHVESFVVERLCIFYFIYYFCILSDSKDTFVWQFGESFVKEIIHMYYARAFKCTRQTIVCRNWYIRLFGKFGLEVNWVT